MTRKLLLAGSVAAALAALIGGCGLENIANLSNPSFTRPASRIVGTPGWADPKGSQLSATDGDGNPIAAFYTTASPGRYEVRLPSGKYSMIMVHARVGSMELRALVPSVGEETFVTEDLDARGMTEALIVEARLSADGKKFKQIDTNAYLGTRNLIRAGLDAPGPTQELYRMVQRLMAKADPASGQATPDFFATPVLGSDFTVKTSPMSAGWIARNPFDYSGDGRVDADTVALDATLAEVAKLYQPAGCPDPEHVRVVFTVDFNAGAKNGNCASGDRFKWATDKPGKQMFFVGWIHRDSPVQAQDSPPAAALLQAMGNSTPNQVPMYDDGTNGDEVAGDNVWTVTFTAPRGDPAAGRVVRIGYKYTWGTRGALWTGSEEWPGNSRILEVVDVNGDGFVYRHDVFGDEATNKDASNLNQTSATGTITWTTDLHGCGPEARENTYDNATCSCKGWLTPKGIGPITVACTQ